MDARAQGQLPDYAPPPYAEVSDTPSRFDPSSLASNLRTQLATVPDRIRATQESQAARQTLADTAIVDQLTPVIGEFFDFLGNQSTTPRISTLTIVPSLAVPHDAHLSGMDDTRRRGEIAQLVRLDVQDVSHKLGTGDSKNISGLSVSSGYNTGLEFSDWGRWDEPSTSAEGSGAATYWFRDEAMAKRLASHLQPKPQPRKQPPPQTAVQAVVEQEIPAEREKKGWGWRRLRGAPSAANSSAADAKGYNKPDPAPVETDNQPSLQLSEADRAEMTVRAEEVAFRRENEFGIWESTNGWGLVVVVKIQ